MDFPCRPPVNPWLNFGQSSEPENSRSCRKRYTKSQTHFLGILTFQFVFWHYKLISISKILVREEISAALSRMFFCSENYCEYVTIKIVVKWLSVQLILQFRSHSQLYPRPQKLLVLWRSRKIRSREIKSWIEFFKSPRMFFLRKNWCLLLYLQLFLWISRNKSELFVEYQR